MANNRAAVARAGVSSNAAWFMIPGHKLTTPDKPRNRTCDFGQSRSVQLTGCALNVRKHKKNTSQGANSVQGGFKWESCYRIALIASGT